MELTGKKSLKSYVDLSLDKARKEISIKNIAGIGYIRFSNFDKGYYPLRLPSKPAILTSSILYNSSLYQSTPGKTQQALMCHVSGRSGKGDQTINGFPKMATNLSPIKMIL